MKKALLIGINYTAFSDISLYGCIDDVINIRNVLIDAYDYQPANIMMLRDDDPQNQPTASAIMKNLLLLASESDSLEEIWIHYSGHGSQIMNPKSDEVNKLDSILVPIDYQTAGFIGEQTLLKVIQKIRCRAILLFDSCHSGSICDLPYSIIYQGPNQYMKQVNNHIVVTNPNVIVISGCKNSQTSADTYSVVLRDPVGAFTNAFIECLRAGKHNNDILELYGAVCQNLVQNGYSQTPVLSSSVPSPQFLLVRATPVLKSVLPLAPMKPVVQPYTAKQTVKSLFSSVMNRG